MMEEIFIHFLMQLTFVCLFTDVESKKWMMQMAPHVADIRSFSLRLHCIEAL